MFYSYLLSASALAAVSLGALFYTRRRRHTVSLLTTLVRRLCRADRRRSPSDQTEMPKRLFDCLTLFGRARYDATTPTGAVRCTARRYAPKSLDMSDPGGFRDETVVMLNELLYLAVGRHPSPSSSSTLILAA
jgi:hypothetical protein